MVMSKIDPVRDAREATADFIRDLALVEPRLQESPGRDALVSMGKNLWSLSYQHTQDDNEAFERLAYVMQQRVKRNGEALEVAMASSFLYMPLDQITSCFAARWADQAFPTFRMGHKYAAALMSTSVSVTEDAIRPPFKAFLIEVPDGLISIIDPNTSQTHDVRYLLAHAIMISGEITWNFAATTTGRVTIWQHGHSTAKMLEEIPVGEGHDWSAYSFGMPLEERDQRVNFLLQRLILNTCLAVANPDNISPVGKKATKAMSPSAMRSSNEPLVRTFIVGKPIELDCREPVRDFLEGRKPGKKLSVQILVAGHWKSQPHGPKNSLRKVIWREPYWRGPDEAPILTRPHKLNEEQS